MAREEQGKESAGTVETERGSGLAPGRQGAWSGGATDTSGFRAM